MSESDTRSIFPEGDSAFSLDRAVTVVVVLFGVGIIYQTYLFVIPSNPESVMWLFVIGTLVGLVWAVWRWASMVRSLGRARRATTTGMLAGLLLTVSSEFGENPGCPLGANTFDGEPWRHPEFGIWTAAGPFGFDVPMLVLDSTVHGFCPTVLALPHLLGGVVLIIAAAVADRRLRARNDGRVPE